MCAFGELCVCFFTYSSFNFSVGGHQRLQLLHHAAGKVTDASFLFPVIRALHLKGKDAKDLRLLDLTSPVRENGLIILQALFL